MQILSEREIEDILAIHPELIEAGLTLIERQGQLETRRTDLIYSDNEGNVLLVELKKGMIIEEDIAQITDYMERLGKTVKTPIRAMLVGQTVPREIQEICKEKGVEWKAISTERIFEYVQRENQRLYEMIFVEGKLHEEAKKVRTMNFQTYLNETSTIGGPYTSYQFFKPIDASPELSDDATANQEVADQFIQQILGMPFNRTMFNKQIHLYRKEDSKPKWSVKAKGAWQGYELEYEMYVEGLQEPIPCEIYVGTIGYRGNKKTFADERSRFLVARIGRGKKRVTTQYGFHKYLRTDAKSLYPFYELKFNAQGLPKVYWEQVYQILDDYGYFVRESDEKKPTKVLWVGDVCLNDKDTEHQLGNLLESLFAVTVLKSYYKGEEKGFRFDFLSQKLV